MEKLKYIEPVSNKEATLLKVVLTLLEEKKALQDKIWSIEQAKNLDTTSFHLVKVSKPNSGIKEVFESVEKGHRKFTWVTEKHGDCFLCFDESYYEMLGISEAQHEDTIILKPI